MKLRYRKMLAAMAEAEAESESAPRTWSVYISRCADGTLYTGIAKDVAARLGQHNAGKGATSPHEIVKVFESR